jgi:hypothetical protein
MRCRCRRRYIGRHGCWNCRRCCCRLRCHPGAPVAQMVALTARRAPVALTARTAPAIAPVSRLVANASSGFIMAPMRAVIAWMRRRCRSRHSGRYVCSVRRHCRGSGSRRRSHDHGASRACQRDVGRTALVLDIVGAGDMRVDNSGRHSQVIGAHRNSGIVFVSLNNVAIGTRILVFVNVCRFPNHVRARVMHTHSMITFTESKLGMRDSCGLGRWVRSDGRGSWALLPVLYGCFRGGYSRRECTFVTDKR